MPIHRRFRKSVVVLLALAVFGVLLSACTLPEAGTLKVTQPSGIGSVRVHLELCAEPGENENACEPGQTEGEAQLILGIAVPNGASAPATITATPTVGGGPPIVFTRNQQAAQALSEPNPFFEEEPWPPAGTEGIGYLSKAFVEQKEVLKEWSVDADFGLPGATGGTPYTGPFKTAVAFGYRAVGEEAGPADRPVKCIAAIGEAEPSEAFCGPFESAELGTADLRIQPPAETPVYVGGQAAIAFPLDFASTAPTQPSFNLSASSSLTGATLALSAPTFAPGTPAGDTHRATDSRTVTVTVPKTALPGTYDVTLTATTAQGAKVSQVAKLVVAKPAIKFGKLKLNKKNGTATLLVTVPAAGKITLSGKGLKTAKRTAKATGKLKLPIKAKGKAKKKLATTGKAKVNAKVTFAPASGAPVSKSRKVTLKKQLG